MDAVSRGRLMHQKITLGFMRVLRLASLLSLGLVAVRAMAQTSYVVEDLGALDGDTSSVAFAINANGDVVGWSRGRAGSRAFLYTNASGMVALPGLPDRPRTVARDINDAGVIVGSANAGGVDRRGLYTLTIQNVARSQYTFNPSQSVLSNSITVP